MCESKEKELCYFSLLNGKRNDEIAQIINYRKIVKSIALSI